MARRLTLVASCRAARQSSASRRQAVGFSLPPILPNCSRTFPAFPPYCQPSCLACNKNLAVIRIKFHVHGEMGREH